MDLVYLFPSTLPVFFPPHLVCSATAWWCSIFTNGTEEGGWCCEGLVEGEGRGRFCSVAGLVKLTDEKGKLVFLAGWGFILLAALIHLSRFKVSAAVVAAGVAITPQGC